jgi:membrane associated rhomboid family serine protease
MVYCFKNWDILGPMKVQMMIFFGIIIGFAVMNAAFFPESGIDSWGHLGGLIFGILISTIMLQPFIPPNLTNE